MGVGWGGMAHDILILFAAYVTDTDCWARNGRAPGCAFMTFKY